MPELLVPKQIAPVLHGYPLVQMTLEEYHVTEDKLPSLRPGTLKMQYTMTD